MALQLASPSTQPQTPPAATRSALPQAAASLDAYQPLPPARGTGGCTRLRSPSRAREGAQRSPRAGGGPSSRRGGPCYMATKSQGDNLCVVSNKRDFEVKQTWSGSRSMLGM